MKEFIKKSQIWLNMALKTALLGNKWNPRGIIFPEACFQINFNKSRYIWQVLLGYKEVLKSWNQQTLFILTNSKECLSSQIVLLVGHLFCSCSDP